MVHEIRVNKFRLIMTADQLFLMFSNLLSSQNQNVPYKMFLRKLGFLAEHQTRALHRWVWRGVGSSGVGVWRGWLWSKPPGAATHRGHRGQLEKRSQPWACLDKLQGTCSRELHSSASEEASSRLLYPLKQDGGKGLKKEGDRNSFRQ